MPVVQLPRLGRSRADQARHLLSVQAGALCEVQSLRQRLHQARNTDLVDHLGQLSGAGRPHKVDSRAVTLKKRMHAVVVHLATAHHDGQLAAFGASLASGYRRIQKRDISFAGRAVELTRQLGRGRSVIDVSCSRTQSGQDSFRPRGDFPHVLVTAHAAENELGMPHGLCGAGRKRPAKLVGPAPGFALRTVEYRHSMPRPRQVPGHRIAHHPQSDKRYSRHPLSLATQVVPCKGRGRPALVEGGTPSFPGRDALVPREGRPRSQGGIGAT